MVNVQNAIKRAEPKLPAEVTKVGVTVAKRSSDILAMISFLSDGTKLNAIQLCNYVTVNIKDPIARLDGVAAVSILATKEYSMRIWMDPLRMSAIGITTQEIVSAINSQNIQAAAGSIGNENSNDFVEYKVNMLGRLKTPEQFGEMIIRDDGEGNIVRLRDIARIELGAKSYSGEVYLNNKECVGTAIYRLDDSNALDTIDRVKKELDKLSKSFPDGVSYQITYDPTEFIRVTMSEIVTTLVVALLLVIAITYLFLQDWRATLIPTLAIPVALMATFPFFLIFGYSINVLTMFDSFWLSEVWLTTPSWWSKTPRVSWSVKDFLRVKPPPSVCTRSPEPSSPLLWLPWRATFLWRSTAVWSERFICSSLWRCV